MGFFWEFEGFGVEGFYLVFYLVVGRIWVGVLVFLLVRRCLNGFKRLWVEIFGSEIVLEEVGDVVVWSIRVGGVEVFFIFILFWAFLGLGFGWNFFRGFSIV